MKTYYIDKFRLNGDCIQIKFEPFSQPPTTLIVGLYLTS